MTNAQPEHVYWEETNNRFYTGICACRDCRATTGALFQALAFVPASCIKQKSGDAYKPGMDGLTMYQGSGKAKRYFCPGCGAFAFFAHNGLMLNEDVGLLGVGVGLLQSETGSKANDWLFWDAAYVHFEEGGNHKPLIEALRQGLVSWGKAAYGEDSIALSKEAMEQVFNKSIKAAKASG